MTTIKHSLTLLGLDYSATKSDIKAALKNMYIKHQNGLIGGCDLIIRELNNAKEILKDYDACLKDSVEASRATFSFYDLSVISDKYNALMLAIDKNAINDITFSIIGSWLWVEGNTYPIKDILKEYGFRWGGVKKAWAFNGSGNKTRYNKDFKSVSDIKNKYKSSVYKSGSIRKIA